MELIIENVRCFTGKHRIPIAPLTLLVGENSSGKTTMLAALAAACGAGFPIQPKFNEPPYSLGNFETIASHGKNGLQSSTSFSLGYANVRNEQNGPNFFENVARYEDRGGVPGVAEVRRETSAFKVIASIYLADGRTMLVIVGDRNGVPFDYRFEIDMPVSSAESLEDLVITGVNELLYNKVQRQESTDDVMRILPDLDILLRRPKRPIAISIAPIRTKPERTYDRLSLDHSPEGDHVPFILSDVLSQPELKLILDSFGKESGLFADVSVRSLTNDSSGPVQVLVSDSEGSENILYVGYGVSQVLPVIVEGAMSDGDMILLQQPEVHLHPRAQAALGSFLVESHQRNGMNFVVETHSDYVIDRIRREVAKKKIPAEEVGILYFEKRGGESTVYPLSLDAEGNIVNAPPSYREFFLAEELELLFR